ncbi:MAG: hypothetical protein HQK63_09630 [Desulfamplus sp.]|nr:hypothetical protein [Desulfamplus sp.]
MDKRKLAVITAAVFTYIKTQEEAAFAPTSFEQPCVSSFAATPQNYPSVWGLAGRNTQMNMRSMMQIRAFK